MRPLGQGWDCREEFRALVYHNLAEDKALVGLRQDFVLEMRANCLEADGSAVVGSHPAKAARIAEVVSNYLHRKKLAC